MKVGGPVGKQYFNERDEKGKAGKMTKIHYINCKLSNKNVK